MNSMNLSNYENTSTNPPRLKARRAVEVLIECAKQARCGCQHPAKKFDLNVHEPGCWFPALQEAIAKAEQEAL